MRIKMSSKRNKSMILAIMLNKHRSIFGRLGKSILYLLLPFLKLFRFVGFGYYLFLLDKHSTPDLIKLSRNIELLGKKGLKPQVKIVPIGNTVLDLPEEVQQALSQLINQVVQLKGSLWFDRSGIKNPCVCSRCSLIYCKHQDERSS